MLKYMVVLVFGLLPLSGFAQEATVTYSGEIGTAIMLERVETSASCKGCDRNCVVKKVLGEKDRVAETTCTSANS